MKGRTLTNQDIALGGVLLQQMPLEALPPHAKQFLIEHKKLVRDLLCVAFGQFAELEDAVVTSSESMVWTSEVLEQDPYADDDERDAAELWVKIRFDGLAPRVTLVLREVVGVYTGSRSVVNEWFKDEVDAGIYIDTTKLSFTQNLSVEDLFEGKWSVCERWAKAMSVYRDALEATLQVTSFARATRDWGDEESYDHVLRVNGGEIRFHT